MTVTGGKAPAEVLKQLLEGNKRYSQGQMLRPNQTAERRAELCQGQHPAAVIVGCSDSRVPPEIIFDQGLGDLFVTRVAGNTVDEAALGSIEYAVDHLGARLVVVLGHGKCGAVIAAASAEEFPGHIECFLRPIRESVEKGKSCSGAEAEEEAKANIRKVVEKLKTAQPILLSEVEEGHLQIVGAYYDLATGVVELL